MLESFLIIVSYYQKRNKSTLLRLLSSLEKYKSNVVVVENIDDNEFSLALDLDFEVIKNKNIGMNIGAWNTGFLRHKNYDAYLFLQDECFLKREGFVSAILDRFKKEKDLGMLGETINRKWAHPWPILSSSTLNTFEAGHAVSANPARRVDAYLATMRSWGISPGATGEHLRSLIWAFPGDVMRRMGGFPVGRNRGECIAAEIAVSRNIIAMGLRFAQIEHEPFSYFGHEEWRADGESKR